MAKESTVAGKGQGLRKLRAGSVEHSRDLEAWGVLILLRITGSSAPMCPCGSESLFPVSNAVIASEYRRKHVS